MTKNEQQIIYYKIECSKFEDGRILGDMIAFAGNRNIGSVGRDLSFINSSAVYISYSPGQICHPSFKDRAISDLIKEFEVRLTQSGLKWGRFDLEDLLNNIKI